MRVIDSTHYLIDVSLKEGALVEADRKDRNSNADSNLAETNTDQRSTFPKTQYPFNLPVVKNLKTLTFHPKVTFLVGENGSGKSTLLEAIAVAAGLNAEGGSKNFNFSTTATHSNLYEHLLITKGIKSPKDSFFLRAETFYNVATEVKNLEFRENSPYGQKDLHAQSHGESFISLIENRFRGNGLYILDEPEAALSPANQFKFLALIHALLKRILNLLLPLTPQLF